MHASKLSGLVHRDWYERVVAERDAAMARAEKAEAELSTEQALREDLSKQIKEAWDACPVAGAIRGMTTLADVVQVAYETIDEFKASAVEAQRKVEELQAQHDGDREYLEKATTRIAELTKACEGPQIERDTAAEALVEAQTELAARPVAVPPLPEGKRAGLYQKFEVYRIPPDVKALIDAFGVAHDRIKNKSVGLMSDDARDFCDLFAPAVAAYRALSTAPYRCVQGVASSITLARWDKSVDPSQELHVFHHGCSGDTPVTLCYPAPKGGEK